MTKPLCIYGGKKTEPLRGQWLPSPEKSLKVLNFSGGKQSSLLAWMVLRGEIERPDVVLTANPGMEAAASLAYVKMMQEKLQAAGIKAYTVVGPNLYEGLLGIAASPKTRFDLPAYYTKSQETGKVGKIMQLCTGWSKIAPMNRASRVELELKLGISRKATRIPAGTVEKWIGFSSSEVSRIKPPTERWSCFRYPLIDMEMTNGDVVKYFAKNNLPMPPRSVCNACFANDATYYKDMAANRPSDWEQAKSIDVAIRDLRKVGLRDPAYLLRSCISLEQLEKQGFVDGAAPDTGCDSGYCMS